MLISKKIAEYSLKNMKEFLGILEKTVNFESHTYGDATVKNICGEYLKNLFEGIGFNMNRLDAKEAGFHIYGKYGNGSKKILLVGHYDTVFPMGTTEKRPFSIKGNMACGPGVFDMKGGIISAYMAVKALKELNLIEDREIDIFLSCDEEAGSVTSKEYIMNMAKKADAALVMEPGHIGEGYVTAERYGRSVYTIKAHGVEGHAGNRPEYSSNAIVELSHQIAKINAYTDADQGITFTAVSMHSGDVGATALIPGEGYAIFDIRYSHSELEKKAREVFESIVPFLDNMKIEVLGDVEKPCIEQNETNKKVYSKAKEIVEEMGFDFLPTKLGGGSDGNFTASVGCPTLDGLGLNGEFLHNPKEYILIDTIPQRVALLGELIRTL